MKNSNQIRVSLLPVNIISYALFFNIILEEFEDTKGVIRIRKSKTNWQHNGQKKRTKEQATIYRTLCHYINTTITRMN
jgi:hypothetical protein